MGRGDGGGGSDVAGEGEGVDGGDSSGPKDVGALPYRGSRGDYVVQEDDGAGRVDGGRGGPVDAEDRGEAKGAGKVLLGVVAGGVCVLKAEGGSGTAGEPGEMTGDEFGVAESEGAEAMGVGGDGNDGGVGREGCEGGEEEGGDEAREMPLSVMFVGEQETGDGVMVEEGGLECVHGGGDAAWAWGGGCREGLAAAGATRGKDRDEAGEAAGTEGMEGMRAGDEGAAYLAMERREQI